MRKAKLEELVAGAQAGDAEAFGELVRRYQDMAVGYAWGVLGDADAADDAAQDAFVDAMHGIRSLRHPRAFGAWLRRIVFKHCDRQTRRRRPRLVRLEDAIERAAATEDPLLALENAQLSDALAAALLQLPEKERIAITLHYTAGAPLARLSAFLDVPVNTLKSRLHRGRRRLGREVSTRMGEYGHERRPSKDARFADRVARLIGAAAEGDLARVRAAVGAEPALATAEGPHPYWGGRPTALHVAAEWGAVDVVEELLAAGADPNLASEAYGGWSPLLIAIVRGHPEVVRTLLEAGAVSDVYAASARGDEHRVRQLLTGDPAAATRRGPSQGTALHFAATVEVAQLLLDHGADASARDVYGNTPVRSATARARSDVAELLLPLGPEPDIHLLTALGRADDVSRLIRENPGLLLRETFQHDTLGGYGTPLHVAAQIGRVEMIRLLLALGASVDQRTREDITPLHYAAATGHIAAARALLEAGADPHVRDAVYDATPRDWADFQRKWEMVAFLEGAVGAGGQA